MHGEASPSQESDDDQSQGGGNQGLDDAQAQGTGNQGRINATHYCRCDQHCIPLGTLAASFCCQEDSKVLGRMEAMESKCECITLTERFRTLILDPDVLELKLYTIHNCLSRGPLPNPIPNK
jgi:hypothetical protein